MQNKLDWSGFAVFFRPGPSSPDCTTNWIKTVSGSLAFKSLIIQGAAPKDSQILWKSRDLLPESSAPSHRQEARPAQKTASPFFYAAVNQADEYLLPSRSWRPRGITEGHGRVRVLKCWVAVNCLTSKSLQANTKEKGERRKSKEKRLKTTTKTDVQNFSSVSSLCIDFSSSLTFWDDLWVFLKSRGWKPKQNTADTETL